MRGKSYLNINTLAIVHLYIPVILFFAGWFNIPVAIIGIALILGAVILFCKDNRDGDSLLKSFKSTRGLVWLLLSLLILLMMSILTGAGGLVTSSDDWSKHYFIIEQMGRSSWPVTIDYQGKTGVLSYYIGSYMLPALFMKMTGSTLVSDVVLLIWVVAGLLMCALLIYSTVRNAKPYKLFIIACVIVLFCTFMLPCKILLSSLQPEDLMSGFLWFGAHANVVYSSDVNQIRWAFAQAVPGWLCTALFFKYRYRRNHWGIILSSSILYSAFVFIGLLIMMVALAVYDCIKGKYKEFIKPENIISVMPAFIVALVYLFSYMQPKSINDGMSFSFIDWNGHWAAFVLLHCTWLPFILILRNSKHRDMLVFVSVFLLAISFVEMGEFNDLCLRSTIPAMFILCILFLEKVLDDSTAWWVRSLLLILMFLMFIPDGGRTMLRESYNGLSRDNRAYVFTSLEDFAERKGGFVINQYYNWDTDGPIKYLIRR
ncbi:MAG: hypothetical protein IJ757_00840 [Clostridiales bacterium]|nr:hypothetical protein [Clostridiales bacterium]